MPNMKIQSVNDLLAELYKDPELLSSMKNDPQKALSDLKQSGTIPDTWIYRAVIVILGLVVLISAIGSIILGANTPDSLIGLGATALGAIAGLLAPSPATK